MCQHPAAVLPVLDRREQEMHVGPYPAVERVAVLAELLCARVLDHVGVGEPASLATTHVSRTLKISSSYHARNTA